MRCSNIGYPKTRKEVLCLVQNIVESRGITNEVTNGWWEAFCRRHPNLTLRNPAPLSGARASTADPDAINRYFDLLEQTIIDNNLAGKPLQIFNMDESGLSLDPKPLKCVFRRGVENPVAPSSGDKTQFTVVACISAGGSSMPPMVILDRKTLPPEFTVGEVPGTVYGLSHRGWIDQELFSIWFSNHFLRYAPLARPLLLLMDGHSSHFCPDTVRRAAKDQVILFVLPPHSTHLLQPLDKGTFGPLKSYWRQPVHEYMSKYPGEHVSRHNFSRVFSQAWQKCMTMTNVRAGFKVTGVWPLNRDAVGIPRQKMESLPQETGLAFIPLYSPAVPRKKPVSKRTQFMEEELQSYLPSPSSSSFLSPATSFHSLSSVDFDECSVVSCHPLQSKSLVTKFLCTPSPPAKVSSQMKACGRVLTSVENIKIVEEKQKKKEEKIRMKLERQKWQQERKLAKEVEKRLPAKELKQPLSQRAQQKSEK